VTSGIDHFIPGIDADPGRAGTAGRLGLSTDLVASRRDP